jgi:GGDEF domain-containing protein
MAEAIAEPVVVAHQRRSVRASIGIAFSTGPGESAEDLIRVADQAMYREKRTHPEVAPSAD